MEKNRWARQALPYFHPISKQEVQKSMSAKQCQLISGQSYEYDYEGSSTSNVPAKSYVRHGGNGNLGDREENLLR